MKVYFSDFFEVSSEAIENYGAFNVSLLTDLPLFIDPFLLFNSDRSEYQQLHDEIIRYMKFLRDRSVDPNIDRGLIAAWYRFPEIKQNWLGFSATDNRGRGLGPQFADALHKNLHAVFTDFGKEQVTKGSHIEKLCLIKDGVGRDNISDLTTNLIQGFLLNYTETFAKEHIRRELRRKVVVAKARFNYSTETWERVEHDLPFINGDYVLLTPKDMLTKDDTWINKSDLVTGFDSLPDAIPDDQLRAQVNNYFAQQLPRKYKRKDELRAATATILHFPEIIDFYIRQKEDSGARAKSISSLKVRISQELYVEHARQLVNLLAFNSNFYGLTGDTYEEAFDRVTFLKDIIENKDGYRILYLDGKPIADEDDLQILYRLTWRATPSDVSRESNSGRGPVDFKISRGSQDKTLVEFKLAKNSQLKRNLANQTAIYEKAHDTNKSIKVILYFTEEELARVQRILKALQLSDDRNIVLIDARSDNKPSASKA
jgi:hypothetical protein